MPDPWLVDGKPHPAVEVIGSWEESERTSACVQDGTAGNGWWIRYRTEFASGESHIWYVSITSRVAHALLEKQAREWLRERHIDVFFFPGCGWNVFRWVPVDEPRGYRREYLLKSGKWACVTAEDRDRIAVFETYPAAQQVAILAEGSE